MPAHPHLQIGDGSEWSFFNGAWEDGPEYALLLPDQIRRQDGPAIQGHHYAFHRVSAYTDLHAHFQIRLSPHGDAGLIFRATDRGHFNLLHFPDCGQASRAQHFWAALSRMDDSGYLRLRALEMIRRVSSTGRNWLDIDVRLVDDHLLVRIGETGLLAMTDPTLQGGGFIGAYTFGQAEIRRLSVDGVPHTGLAFDESAQPQQNWFPLCPDTRHSRWQRPGQLVRTPGGELLLNFTAQEYPPFEGKTTALAIRSTDDGRTWSDPAPVEGVATETWDNWGVVHRFPDGGLRMLIPSEEEYQLAETDDDGRIWQSPQPVAFPSPPPGLRRVHLGPQAFTDLADGSVVMFAYGGHDSTVSDSSIFTWGSHHCQAFASRSADGGRTWSPWVNIDGTRDSEGRPVDGNLDLTEVCAAQTGDGHLLALIRPIFSPWMWETWSSDGGLTWGPCVRGPFPGYATPNMLRTASGTLLVAHRLPGCTIHASRDDGRSWDRGTLIDSAIWVMGSMIEVEPDLVLYAYWDSFESLMRAQFIRITPDGLQPVHRESLE